MYSYFKYIVVWLNKNYNIQQNNTVSYSMGHLCILSLPISSRLFRHFWPQFDIFFKVINVQGIKLNFYVLVCSLIALSSIVELWSDFENCFYLQGQRLYSILVVPLLPSNYDMKGEISQLSRKYSNLYRLYLYLVCSPISPSIVSICDTAELTYLGEWLLFQLVQQLMTNNV